MARIHCTGTTPTALVIGEALVDIVVRPDGTRTIHPGGSPMNVAVGLGRLGVETMLAARVGEDAFSGDIRSHLRDAGVSLAQEDRPADRTSSAMATLRADGSARYEFDVLWDVEKIHADPVPVLHTGSIATILAPGADAVAELFEAAPATTLLSIDPNIRPDLITSRAEAVDRTERLASRAHVVKMSDEDLDWLYPGASVQEVASHYQELGVKLLVLTCGAEGCALFSSGVTTVLPAQQTTVVDTIGAGDAFMSGLLFGVLRSDSSVVLRERRADRALLEQLGRIAQHSAALTVARRGGTPPTLRELQGSAGQPSTASEVAQPPRRPATSQLIDSA